jgi:aminoglycoside phosphotransferase (APT) family kinase protein
VNTAADDDGGMRLLARGREADVYVLDDTRVLRRFRDPDRDTAHEAKVMDYLAARGYPVPRVHDTDGPVLVLERLHGPTIMQAWQRTPWRVHHYAKQLADLHNALAAVPAPDWLHAPNALPEDEAGAGSSVLHLDLHPLNVILTPDRGPVVIDWTNAAAGDPAYELARTLVILGTADIPHPLARVIRGRYLRALRRNAAADPAPRMADAARVRLTDLNNTPSENARLQALLARAAA